MSEAKTTLMFTEFSDLCRGSIGYSHHMVALFDECDNAKHSRHPISFIEAVKRLKKTIKLLFERLETDNKKHVAEYLIGHLCIALNVGKKVNLMKPTTSPVALQKQCDGMIIIACITEELIPKVIMENKKNDARMDPLVYVHGLNQALIQHFTFNSPDCRLRNKTYDYKININKLSSVEAVAIYVAYNYRQESADKLLRVKDVQEKNLLKLQLEEIGLQYCGNIQQEDGNSFFLACEDQLKCLGYDVKYLELKQMVITLLKCLHETDYRDEFTRTDWPSYIDRLSNDAKECIRDVVVRTTGSCLKQNIIIYCRGSSNELVKKSFPREGIATSIVLAEENNYYISLKKIPQWQERTGIKRPADLNPTPETPTKKVFDAEKPGFENREKPLTTSKLVNKKGATMVITTQSSADSQVPSVSSTLQETTVQSESHPQRESTKAQPHMAAYTSPTQKYKLTNERKSAKKKTKKMTKDEKILILNCYNELNIKTDYDVLAEQVYKKREKYLSRELVQHYEKTLDVSTTLKSRIKGYIQRIQRGKDNETDQEVTDLIMKSGLITTEVTMHAEKLISSLMGL